MKKIFYFICILQVIVLQIHAESIKSVSPGQDIIGVSKNSQIVVELNISFDSLNYKLEKLFQVYGSNSGLVQGIIEKDDVNRKFTFTPIRTFYSGEIVNASFGPLIKQDDGSAISFHWRFTIEITNSTISDFDSLKRFNYPSLFPIAIDYDHDGDIDIVSGTGRVIYNDGYGNFTSFEEKKELLDISYMVDVNNDGFIDLINSAGEYTNQTTVSISDSNGDFTNKQILYPYNNAGGSIKAVGDINGDGFSDLIATEIYDEFFHLWRIFFNDGTGTFIRDTVEFRLTNYIAKIDLVDLNKDGKLDIVLLVTITPTIPNQFAGALVYYNNNNDFNNTKPKKYSINGNSFLSQLFLMDYDNNGLIDIAGFGSEEGGAILLQEELGIFDENNHKTDFSGPENFAYFTSGDINGDNRFDIIVSNYQVDNGLGGDGEVSFEATINCVDSFFQCDTGYGGFFSLGFRKDVGDAVVPVMADVDNDGDLDIIHTGYPTTVTYNQSKKTGLKIIQDTLCGFKLSQNYPNPFNSQTIIKYSILSESNVVLSIYNILGQSIKCLVKTRQKAGKYSINFNANNLASGVYYYTIHVSNQSSKFGQSQMKTKKLIYIK